MTFDQSLRIIFFAPIMQASNVTANACEEGIAARTIAIAPLIVFQMH
jgi:hypothetical protein